MHLLAIKSTTNNNIYIMQELHTFYKNSMELQLKFHYKEFHFHQYFHYILRLIYQLFFFCTDNSYNLNILQYHTIYHIHSHNY